MVALVRSGAIPPSDLTTVVLANEGHFSALARAISEHLPKLLDVQGGRLPERCDLEPRRLVAHRRTDRVDGRHLPRGAIDETVIDQIVHNHAQMALPTGSRFGGYEVIGNLGAGGMGEVYRARDPRLGRDVAIKVLSAPFVADGERLARFEREARLLASLNHPGIGAIYGSSTRRLARIRARRRA